MTVALSRARFGLYVLGRRSVFESCYELSEAFSRLISSRGTKLELVTGEMWPIQRLVGEKSPEGTVVMEDVTHLGQYVYEMTITAVERIKTGGRIGGVGGTGVDVVVEGGGEVEQQIEEEERGEDDGDGGAVAMEL